MQKLSLILNNSKSCRELEKILAQKENFLNTLDGLDVENQCSLFKKILLDLELLIPFSKKHPLLYIFSEDAKAILLYRNRALPLLNFILNELTSNLYMQWCLFPYYGTIYRVFIFTYDKNKISKVVMEKLVKDKTNEKRYIKKNTIIL